METSGHTFGRLRFAGLGGGGDGDDAFRQCGFALEKTSIPDHHLGEVSRSVVTVKDWLDERAPESRADGAEADDVAGGALT